VSVGRSEPLAGAPAGRRALRIIVETRELTLAILIAAIVVGMSIASPFFLSLANFHAIVIGMAPTAIIAVGMTVLLASGGFDLSVGSVLALASTIVALLLIKGASIPTAAAGACWSACWSDWRMGLSSPRSESTLWWRRSAPCRSPAASRWS
jgi:ribose/xylose/arabinose/galactoside ABC-type transport system permease subunit